MVNNSDLPSTMHTCLLNLDHFFGSIILWQAIQPGMQQGTPKRSRKKVSEVPSPQRKVARICSRLHTDSLVFIVRPPTLVATFPTAN